MRARSFELRRPRLVPLVALPVAIVGLVGVVGSTGSADPAPAGGSGAANEVDIAGFAFTPKTVEVEAGTTVVWTNQDGAGHSVEDAGGLFEESEDLQAGDAFRFTYAEPGTYPYFCGIHQYMRGEIVVRG